MMDRVLPTTRQMGPLFRPGFWDKQGFFYDADVWFFIMDDLEVHATSDTHSNVKITG